MPHREPTRRPLYRLEGRTPPRALGEASGIENLPSIVVAEIATTPAARNSAAGRVSESCHA